MKTLYTLLAPPDYNTGVPAQTDSTLAVAVSLIACAGRISNALRVRTRLLPSGSTDLAENIGVQL